MSSQSIERRTPEIFCQGFALTSFPEEILSMISKCVQEPSTSFSLDRNGDHVKDFPPKSTSVKALSETCKTLRRIASPDLFRTVSIDHLPAIIETSRINNRRVIKECFDFLSPYVKSLNLQASLRYSPATSRLVLQRILPLLPSLESIVNMPHDILYSEEMVEAITAHSNLQSVEVTTIAMVTHDSRKPGQQLPCTPLFQYHITLPLPPWTVSLYRCFPESQDPGMRIYSLSLSSTVDDLGLLTNRRQIFPSLSVLSLKDVKDTNCDRDIVLLDAFLQLNPTIEHLEVDGLALFLMLGHNKHSTMAVRSAEDFPYLKVHSSSWDIAEADSVCQKLAVYTERESEMGESVEFFVDIPKYIPALNELAIDLGYYVGPSSKSPAERLSDVMRIIMPIVSSLASLRNLSRLDVHCLMDDQQQKALVFSFAATIPSLQVVAFGRGLLQPDKTKRSPPMAVFYIVRNRDGLPVKVEASDFDPRSIMISPGPMIETVEPGHGKCRNHCKHCCKKKDERDQNREMENALVANGLAFYNFQDS